MDCRLLLFKKSNQHIAYSLGNIFIRWWYVVRILFKTSEKTVDKNNFILYSEENLSSRFIIYIIRYKYNFLNPAYSTTVANIFF